MRKDNLTPDLKVKQSTYCGLFVATHCVWFQYKNDTLHSLFSQLCREENTTKVPKLFFILWGFLLTLIKKDICMYCWVSSHQENTTEVYLHHRKTSVNKYLYCICLLIGSWKYTQKHSFIISYPFEFWFLLQPFQNNQFLLPSTSNVAALL